MARRKSRTGMSQNFSDGAVATDSAVATANLVSILDPCKVDDDGVETLAEATGTKEDFVEELVNLVDDANDACEKGIPEETVIENYSRKTREVLQNAPKHKVNFADVPTEDKLTNAAEIVSMVDDDALDNASSKEIAQTISEATGAPEEAVEAIVDVAKDNFAAGKKYAIAHQRKINRQNFARITFAELPEGQSVPESKVEPDAPVAAPEKDDRSVPNPVAQDPVNDNRLETKGSEGIEQNPDLEKNDPQPGEVAQSAVPAGEAMAVQNELATVQDVNKVPEAESNFSRNQRKGGSEFDVLAGLLGDKYIK